MAKSDEDLLSELPDRLRLGLKTALQTRGGLGNLRAIKEYLLKLDNKQRADFKLIIASKPTSTTETITMRTKAMAIPLPSTTRASATRTSAVELIPVTRSIIKHIICFDCGKTDHYR